jgi:hypothetical protein
VTTKVKIVGVHPVDAEEPVHLIEILVEGHPEDFDVDKITQEDHSQPRANWQVAYDLRILEQTEEKARLAFFFHYLSLHKPLLTSLGPLQLLEPTKAPAYLKLIVYEPP